MEWQDLFTEVRDDPEFIPRAILYGRTRDDTGQHNAETIPLLSSRTWPTVQGRLEIARKSVVCFPHSSFAGESTLHAVTFLAKPAHENLNG